MRHLFSQTKLYILLCFFHFSATSFALADEQKVINWGLLAQYPWFITEGDNVGQGILDKQIDAIAAQMPKYTHKRTVLSLSRLIKDMKAGKSYCLSAMVKSPERQEFTDFSPVVALSLSNGLITSKQNMSRMAEFIKPDGSVDLLSLISKTDFTINVLKDRAYSQQVDRIIDFIAQRDPSAITIQSGLAQRRAILKQIFSDHLGGTIGRATEFYVHAKELGYEKDFVYLRIFAEAVYTKSYVGCTKTPGNKKLMADLSRAVREVRTQSGYLTSILDWVPEYMHPQYQEIFTMMEQGKFDD